jgi:putative CocE/NonD family hydrolase
MNVVQAARAGYVVIVQDCRGRFASEGAFDYFHSLPQEGPDGYDTVEWAAALPYADGQVGMFGGSYFGWTQWAPAMQRPPHLRAIAPAITWAKATDGLVYRGGAMELGLGLSWYLSMSLAAVGRKLAAEGIPPAQIAETVGKLASALDRLCTGGYGEAPLNDLPTLRETGLSELIRPLLDGGPGALPQAWNVVHAAVDVPTLSIGGWYDIFTQATLDAYAAMRAAGRPSQLVMGPWIHGTELRSTIGEVDFGVGAGAASIGLQTSLTALQLRWFDHWLRGVDNGVEREAPAKVFLMGENRWLDLPDWPPAEARAQPFYLHPGAALGPAAPTDALALTRYAYDPADPAPTLGGNTLMAGVYPAGVVDQRPLARRPDVLTFLGAPLERPLTIMGRVTANLWVSSSAPDTDFVVRLLDVRPDGAMHNLCDGILRARYREGLDAPRWLQPGVVYALPIDLWSTAHTVQAGHRLGVMVTSSSFPRWDRNWNTTEDPATAASGQIAQQAIWHDAAHPSHIVLPVMNA